MAVPSKPIIVVIEDDSDLGRLMCEILSDEERYEAICVPDVESCLSLLQARAVDLVLSDVTLANDRGAGLRQNIEAIEEGSGARMGFVSALSGRELDALGLNDYLRKPFDVDELLNYAGGLLKKRFPTAQD